MIKKLTLFLFGMLLFTPINVFAEPESWEDSNLIYSIDRVDITATTISFQGWAYIDRVHSIGGHNYEVSIYAIREDFDVNSVFDVTATTNIKGTRSNILKEDGTSTGSKYGGGNMLYPLTCQRGGTNNCKDLYYGHPKGAISDSAADASTSIRNYAKCSGSGSTLTSCIYYNPKFNITFDVSDLKNKFGTNPITFVIVIDYRKYNTIGTQNDGKDSCYYDTDLDKYIGCNGAFNTSMGRYLTFHNTNEILKNNSGNVFEKINVEVEKYFRLNATSNTSVQDDLGKRTGYLYLNDSDYDIDSSTSLKFVDTDMGVESYKFRLYKVNTKYQYYASVGGYRYGPRSHLETCTVGKCSGYSWSAWGILTGKIKIELPEMAFSPGPRSCNVNSPGTNCNVNNTIEFDDCNKLISYSIALDDSYKNKFNDPGCNDPTYLIVGKVFRFREEVKLKMNDALINNKMFDKRYNPNRGFEYKFQFYRDLRWIEDSDYDNSNSYNRYFYKIRHYIGSSCDQKDTYVSYNFLKQNDLDDDVSNRNSDIIIALKKFINKYNEVDLDYVYPNVNDASKTVNSGYIYINGGYSDNKIDKDLIEDATNPGYKGDTINYLMRNAGISKDGLGKKNYFDNSIPVSNTNWIDGGRNYYIPPNVLLVNSGVLQFKTIIKGFSILDNSKKITSLCEINNDSGKYENMRYRVIDEKNPFPNYEPGKIVSGKKIATNWETMWNDVNKFNRGTTVNGIEYLLIRNNKSNVEKYIANLNQNNISLIRQYNVDKFYKNVKMSGSSYTPGYSKDFVNKVKYKHIFTIEHRNNTKMSLPGKRGVDA